MNPTVSVIVTVFNREQYIVDCARSLFEQTLDNIEFIFVDDASIDKSIELLYLTLNNYPDRISFVKIISLQKNEGVANARNIGLENATGEYVIHADSDDWVDNDIYERLYSKAKETNADIVGCDICHEYPNKRSCLTQNYGYTIDDNISRLIRGDIHPSLCTSLARLSLIREHGILFPKGLNMGEDLFFNLNLFLYAQKIEYINFAPYHYRHTTLSSSFHHTRKTIDSGIEIGKKIERLMREVGLYNKYESEIEYRKFSLKLSLVQNFDNYDDYCYWLSVFPETHKHIMIYYKLDWKIRIELWFAAHHMFFMSKLIKRIIEWQHKIKRLLYATIF